MKPSRELDAIIAEKIMGWGPIDIDLNGNPVGINPLYPNKYKCHIIPKYSTSIAAAWEIIEKLKTMVLSIEVSIYTKPRTSQITSIEETCQCNIFEFKKEFEWWTPQFGVIGTTPAHAICLAALRVIERKNAKT